MRSFHVAYFDLNHFKPYNDIYGYEQGDQIIKWLAQILQKQLFRHGHFIGHIGGDDFVAIFKDIDKEQTEEQCNKIIRDFEQDITRFYHQEHIDLGGIKALSRNGTPVFYPLLGLAIGVVQPDPSECLSHHDVALLASEAKKKRNNLTAAVATCATAKTQTFTPNQSSTIRSSSVSEAELKVSSANFPDHTYWQL